MKHELWKTVDVGMHIQVVEKGMHCSYGATKKGDDHTSGRLTLESRAHNKVSAWTSGGT